MILIACQMTEGNPLSSPSPKEHMWSSFSQPSFLENLEREKVNKLFSAITEFYCIFILKSIISQAQCSPSSNFGNKKIKITLTTFGNEKLHNYSSPVTTFENKTLKSLFPNLENERNYNSPSTTLGNKWSW